MVSSASLLKLRGWTSILETEVEPWFTDARVATAVTILRRTDEVQLREHNTTRFVQFRRRLVDIVGSQTGEADRQAIFEALRENILGLTEDTESSDFRARLVRQSELTDGGTDLRNRYVGSKWGRYLRSTETLYRLQLEHAARFVSLSTLAPVERGVTTNCDDFFLVTNISSEALTAYPTAREFRQQFAANRGDVEDGRVRIVRRSDRTEFALETSQLRPVMKTARDIRSFATSAIDNRDFAVSITEDRRDLSPLARRYVEAGEREEWHLIPSFETVRAAGGNWYTLRDSQVSPILFVKTMQYSPLVLLNDAGLIANQRLYKLEPAEGVDHDVLCAILNSTVFACERYAAVKALGREAAIDVEVFSANAFRCPDVRALLESDRELLRTAMSSLALREVGDFREDQLVDAGLFEARAYVESHPVSPGVWPQELQNPDRQLIDEVALRLIGVQHSDVQTVRERMYNELVAHIRKLRLLELEAQANRRGTALSAGPHPRQIADDIWARLISSETLSVQRIPQDFIQGLVTERYQIPTAGHLIVDPPSLFETPSRVRGTLGRHRLDFRDECQAEYVGLLAQNGVFGDISIPSDTGECRAAQRDIERYIQDLLARFNEAVNDITANRQLQQRIIKEALRRVTSRI